MKFIISIAIVVSAFFQPILSFAATKTAAENKPISPSTMNSKAYAQNLKYLEEKNLIKYNENFKPDEPLITAELVHLLLTINGLNSDINFSNQSDFRKNYRQLKDKNLLGENYCNSADDAKDPVYKIHFLACFLNGLSFFNSDNLQSVDKRNQYNLYVRFAREREFIGDGFIKNERDADSEIKRGEALAILDRIIKYQEKLNKKNPPKPLAKLFKKDLKHYCPFGFHKTSAGCVANRQSCSVVNGEGIKTWRKSIGYNSKKGGYRLSENFGQCEITDCFDGYGETEEGCEKFDPKTKIVEAIQRGKMPETKFIQVFSNTTEGTQTNIVPYLKLIEEAKTLSTDREKIAKLYDWIIANVSYDNELYPKKNDRFKRQSYHWTGALINKVAVCGGYAELVQRGLDILNIKNEYVSGKAYGYGTAAGDHGWNKVFIDGDWRYLDATWDSGHLDDSLTFIRKIKHDYYLLPKYCMDINHFENSEPFSPKAAYQHALKYTDSILKECPGLLPRLTKQIGPDDYIRFLREKREILPKSYKKISELAEKVSSTTSGSTATKAHVYFFINSFQEIANTTADILKTASYKNLEIHPLEITDSANMDLMWQTIDKINPDFNGTVHLPYLVAAGTGIDNWSESNNFLKFIFDNCNAKPWLCPALE